MSKLKALLLTQGMHGMISQVEGLAKALNLDYQHQTIKLKKFWNYLQWLEEQRMKAAIKSGSAGPLM